MKYLLMLLLIPSLLMAEEQKLTLEQLYAIKGQAVTQIEIAQNTLKFVNEQIEKALKEAEKKEEVLTTKKEGK